MRTLLVVCALALLVALPGAVEAKPDGFGRCEITEVAIGTYEDPVTHEEKPILVPSYECYW